MREMEGVEKFRKDIKAIEAILGYQFKSQELLVEAFSHPSMINFLGKSYERLEFLGDGVLDLYVREWLFKVYPEKREGELTKLKSALVHRKACHEYLLKLGLDKFILILESSRKNFVGDEYFGDLFEALMGALYLDGGAKEFFTKILIPLMNSLVLKFDDDPKTVLQEYLQKERGALPTYEVVGSSGEEHNKTFEVIVLFGVEVLAKGEGNSVKKAEKDAAKKAIRRLHENS